MMNFQGIDSMPRSSEVSDHELRHDAAPVPEVALSFHFSRPRRSI